MSQARTSSAAINYRLVRARLLAEYEEGTVSRQQICDAQPELRRNAAYCGRPSGEDCPVCEETELVHVTYVFGPRLPAHGRCVTSVAEHERLSRRKADYTGYIVEVCPACAWNHLTRTYVL